MGHEEGSAGRTYFSWLLETYLRVGAGTVAIITKSIYNPLFLNNIYPNDRVLAISKAYETSSSAP